MYYPGDVYSETTDRFEFSEESEPLAYQAEDTDTQNPNYWVASASAFLATVGVFCLFLLFFSASTEDSVKPRLLFNAGFLLIGFGIVLWPLVHLEKNRKRLENFLKLFGLDCLDRTRLKKPATLSRQRLFLMIKFSVN